MLDVSERRKGQYQEFLTWAGQTPDASGECDHCYKSPTALWQLPMELDNEPEANFMYCKECFIRIIKRKKCAESMQTIDAEMERMMMGY